SPPRGRPVSVHPDRGAWVVRWRHEGRQRSRRFDSEREAIAFEEGLSGGSGKPRSSTPYVYPYETSAGIRWRYSYRDSRGRASSKRGFATERAAARDRERTMAQIRDRGLYVSRLTFGEFFPEWLRRRRPYVAAGTWTDYEIHGRKRLLPHFGDRRLTAITTFEVRDWLLELHESGDWAPKTLNNALGVLVAALNGAAADRLIALNPAAGVERLPLGHIERDWLRLHEIGPYLGACTPVYRPLAELLIGSGTRISEALALRWDDVDFERRVLRVYRSDKREGEGSTKGKRFRSVQVGPGLLETLRDLRARQAEAEPGDLTRARVFTMPVRTRKRERGRWRSKQGLAPMDRNTVSTSWHKQALADAGLRDMPLHALRHTAAAAWLLTGHPLIYVQRQLGHASIKTTESFYGHLEESFLKSAPAATEAAIREAARTTSL
ncbi:MAG TPA: tyrosine-type recombinase/integrase, partial [Thermoleophilaceae bacterium]|nr:tyrosine-type recombinase/integrase [Thermoleophilaceae bacterium]